MSMAGVADVLVHRLEPAELGDGDVGYDACKPQQCDESASLENAEQSAQPARPTGPNAILVSPCSPTGRS